ncbi:MAG: hypothetical protein Q8L85_09840 [Alphaproteobacteria bacterium]|nr:hypothetical protein [Alphaproteobacteria bacterium]
MKFFSALVLIAIICPHQISALILKIDSIVVSGSNPGAFPALKNSQISKNLKFNINNDHSLKEEITTQLNNNKKLKTNWPFPDCTFVPINLKIYENKQFSNYSFDEQSDIINQTSSDLNLQKALDNSTKITLSINITKQDVN